MSARPHTIALRLGLVAVTVCLVGILLAPAPTEAAYWESFEGPLASWQIAEGDVRYRIVRHERVATPVHSGAWSETIAIEAGGGSHLHATHDIPRVALIDELEIGLWVHADRPGMQIMARVVLPRSIDPRTGQPVALTLHGTIYQTAGRWQRLQLKNLTENLSAQVRIARSDNAHRASDHQITFDESEAYLDQVRLNVYGGQGTTSVSIDDLEMNGFVEVESVQNIARTAGISRHGPTGVPTAAATAYQQSGQPTSAPTRSHIAPVAFENSILATEGKPLLPRIIQYQGEPLKYLRALGFNAAWIDAPPTQELLEEAVAAGVWLVCPAPHTGLPLPVPLDPILSWHVGRDLSRRDLRVTADRVTQLRLIDGASRRPICAHVASNMDAFSRHVDVLLLDRQVIGTTLDKQSYFEWIAANAQMARVDTTFWVRLHDRIPHSFEAQAASLRVASPPTVLADWQQLRTLAIGAIAHGARGLVFPSSSRLDAEDPDARRRAAQLELLNLELSLIEPWAAAGRFSTTVDSSDPNVKAYVLQSDHTRLVLPIELNNRAGEPSAPTFTSVSRAVSPRPGAPQQTLHFVVPGVPAANRAYELSLGGTRLLSSVRVAGGKSVSLDRRATKSSIIMTSDPLVTSRLKKRVAEIRKRAAELTLASATDYSRQTEQTLRQSGRVPAQLVQRPLAEATRSLQDSHALLERGDFHGSVLRSHSVATTIDQVRRLSLGHFGLPDARGLDVSLPVEDRFVAMPSRATVAQTLSSSHWGENRLPAGDCENLRQMVQAGWRHVEFPQQGLTTEVQLSSQLPHSGRTSLHLAAGKSPDSAAPALVETPPVWVETAAVPVKAGDLLQIQGWVRVPQAVQGSVDELLVFDSIGGPDLALRFSPTGSWRRFIIYRAAPQAGQVSVTFAVTGMGEAWIDDVTIQTVGAAPRNHPSRAAPSQEPLPPLVSPTPPATGGQAPVLLDPNARRPAPSNRELPNGDPFSGVRLP